MDDAFFSLLARKNFPPFILGEFMIIQRLFILIIFIPSVVFASLTVAKAQGAVDYRFLEVVDYADKPVADAIVNVRASCDGGEQRTNKKGQLEKGLPVGVGDCGTRDFTISKPGYYPFTDYFNITNSSREPLKIELLIIPKTSAERKAIGKEQLKREFFAAAKTGDAATVRKFLKSGLGANLTTDDLRGVPGPKNIPIIIFAASSGDSETVDEFLKAGVNVRRKNERMRGILTTYLYASPFTKRYPETEAEREQLIIAFEQGAENLIKAGADINFAESYYGTPLMIAAERGYARIVKLLIKEGASVDAKDNYGKTALMRVITNGYNWNARFEMASLLLKSGADVNAVTSDNNSAYEGCKTALMFAIRNNDLEMVKFLLANKADVNLTCKDGETALDLAGKTYFSSEDVKQEIIRLLEAAGAK